MLAMLCTRYVVVLSMLPALNFYVCSTSCVVNSMLITFQKKNSKSVYAIFMDHKILLYLTDLVFARYLDGERLTAEDEKAVVEKLLAYHPHSEDKIGCGLDSIMVSFFVHSFS